jgi:hypothetical protein
VEESFGWMKIIGMLKNVKLRGLAPKNFSHGIYIVASYNRF